MNSVPRKLTLGLMVAFGAAACGDDVTVTEQAPPPAPTPVVRSVVVSPSAATIAVGGSFQFGAAVDADAGLAGTVTWSSSNTAIASVNASGVATATQTAGQTSICATSTADATKSSCAQLTVSPAVAPVTVEIDAVTIGCDQIALTRAAAGTACNLNSPVASNDVYGEIQVQVNVNRPAGSAATGVRLEVIDAVSGAVQSTATQTFSSDVAVDAEGLSAQASSQRVTFTVQTAAYNLLPNATSPTSAAAVTPNGNKRIRVSALGAGGSTASSAERNLFFNNVNGFHMTQTVSLTGNNPNGVPARRNDANGFSWIGGTNLTFVSIPVSYTGVGVDAATHTVSFGGLGCGTTAVTRTVAAGGVAAFPYTAGAAAAAGTLNDYAITSASTCFNTGEFAYSNAQGTDGNPFLLFGLGGVFGGNNTLNTPFGAVMPQFPTIPAYRLDNARPSQPVVTNTVGTRTNAWMNEAVVLNATSAANAANGAITTGSTDVGIGGTVTLTGHAGTCADATACNALAATTSVAGLAESVNNATYGYVARATDVFGNFRVSARVAFGVDKTAPSIINNGSPADQTIVDVTAAEAFGVSASDVLSGFSGGVALRHTLVRVNGAVGGLARNVVIGSGTASTTPFATLAAGTAFIATPADAPYTPAPTVITGTPQAIGAAAAAGYYLYQAQARDQAGNNSVFFTRRFYANNGNQPLVTGLNSSLTYTGGAAASFPGSAQDGTEVVSGELRIAYPNTGGQLIYNRASPAVDPMWDDNMAIPASVPFAVPAFIRGVQVVDGAGALQADFATAKPTAVTGRVFNPFGTTLNIVTAALAPTSGVGASGWSADFSAPLLPTQIQNGSDYNSLAVAVRPTAFIRVSGGACTGTTTRTCVDTVIVRGPTGTFVNPFAGLGLVEAINGTADWRLIGATAAIGQVAPAGVTVTIAPLFSGAFPTLDNGTNRDYKWLVTVARVVATAPVPAGGLDYRLVGVNSTFDGLASVAWNRAF